MGKKRQPPARASLAQRLGWPEVRREVTLKATFAFGAYDGPAVVVAERPGAIGGRPCLVVEFTHPETGAAHQAVVMESEVTECPRQS